MVVKLEFTTFAARVVPDNVPAAAAMVTSALPSKATPLIFLVAANFVAVLALPVKAPVNPVDVTDVNPARVVEDAPKDIAVVPIVVALFANLLFAIAVPLQTPLVIVPTVSKFANDVKLVLVVAVIFPAVVAVVALPVVF